MLPNPTAVDLALILEELRPLEPIFHTRAFGLNPSDRQNRTAPNYWEVGASGRIYSQDLILSLDPTHFVDADSAGWRTSEHAVQSLAPDTFLFTYTLTQQARTTRRATIWQRAPSGWIILFHQGTVVSPGDALH
jgi:hypothetical protein